MFESVAFAMGTPQAGGAPASGTDMLMQFMPLILMFVIFWFLLIRPQQKRAKAHKQMLSELKRGDHVMSSADSLAASLKLTMSRCCWKPAKPKCVFPARPSAVCWPPRAARKPRPKKRNKFPAGRAKGAI